MIQKQSVTVVVATRNRAESLKTLLMHLRQQTFRNEICNSRTLYKVLIVDNGSTDHTQQVIHKATEDFEVESLVEPLPGKSRALNRALEVVDGGLVVFIDDDVIPAPQWLSELVRASRQHSLPAVFCGPVIPQMAVTRFTSWLYEHVLWGPLMLSRFQPNLPEGLLPIHTLPGGSSFAVRRSAIAKLRFRLDLGPSEQGNFMSEDTEFLSCLRERGNSIFFVPAATVTHCIRTELTSKPSMLERAYQFGRSQVRRDRCLLFPHENTVCSTDPDLRIFEAQMVLSLYYGELAELWDSNRALERRKVMRSIETIERLFKPEILPQPAVAWISKQSKRDLAPVV